MKIAYILFNDITTLDFVGIYDPLCRLRSQQFIPDLVWDICSFTDTVADNFGLTFKPDKIRTSLSDYDVVIVPGGYGTRLLMEDEAFVNWLKKASSAQYKVSICTGSLLLGAAGFLKDKKATTHFLEYETLKPYCATVLHDRIVEDGNVITAGAVSSSIDLGLYLCEKWAGKEAREHIRKMMDYHG